MKKWYRQAASFEVSLLPSFQNVMCPVCQNILKFTGADLQHSPFESLIPSGPTLSCMLVQGCSLLKQCDLLQFVLCQAAWLVDWCSSSSISSITNIWVSYLWLGASVIKNLAQSIVSRYALIYSALRAKDISPIKSFKVWVFAHDMSLSVWKRLGGKRKKGWMNWKGRN